MNRLSTDAFPYTTTVVCDQLKTDEAKVVALTNTLGITPHRDERTGKLFYSQRHLDLLRKALEAERQVTSTSVTHSTGSSIASRTGSYASAPQRAPGTGLSRTELSAIVESVSSAKEEILRDLSQLLDDKLSGLDEVVVELIRIKSENDSLREELRRMEESRNRLQNEIDKYKPAAFGFYRKEG